jgi:hypothetical protein
MRQGSVEAARARAILDGAGAAGGIPGVTLVRALLLGLLAALPVQAQEAAEPVDLELVLMADATGSIDEVEIRLQRQGYADAMLDPEVLWAIANGGARGRIAVAYVEWANASAQDVVVDWMVVEDAGTAQLFGERLMAAPRRAYGSNAIGAALLKGKELIETNSFEGWRKVIDLSGDSSWNPQGPAIATARDAVLGADIVINGLAILCRGACSGRPRFEDLEAEYADKLIGGPGAFVVTADGEQSFAQAVRRKLILEIADLR